MRLDKYLKMTRLIKRRTVANEACDIGKIRVNNMVAKASYQVKIGDVIEISLGIRTTKAQVVELPTHINKQTASDYYLLMEST